MIGDNWKNDVEGAKNVGMGNVYYNIKGERGLPFKPGFDMRIGRISLLSYEIEWKMLMDNSVGTNNVFV